MQVANDQQEQLTRWEWSLLFYHDSFGQSVGHAADAAGWDDNSQRRRKVCTCNESSCEDAWDQTSDIQPPNRLQTVTAGGNHFGEVRAFLMAYYGSSVGQKADEPLGTVTTRDRFGLVTIHGTRLSDSRHRYADAGATRVVRRPRLSLTHTSSIGTQTVKSYPKSAQVARCGKLSTAHPFAEAIGRANLPEMCTGSGKFLGV
ncbi:hypothetical protein ACFSND_31265 [Brevibacillus brevis]|uniref:hypothetical protein n=1 Tax=Brevibacillus brevis TaxID=1393 RepID=UPI0036280227